MKSARTSENSSTIWPSYPTSENVSNEVQSAYEKSTYNPVFIATESSDDMETTQMPVEWMEKETVVIYFLE